MNLKIQSDDHLSPWFGSEAPWRHLGRINWKGEQDTAAISDHASEEMHRNPTTEKRLELAACLLSSSRTARREENSKYSLKLLCKVEDNKRHKGTMCAVNSSYMGRKCAQTISPLAVC